MFSGVSTDLMIFDCLRVLLTVVQYYSSIRSLYRHVVCNISVSCKANGDRNQFGRGLDSARLVKASGDSFGFGSG